MPEATETTARQRFHLIMEEVVNNFLDRENPSNSIDLKLQLLRDASDVLWRFQDECDSARQSISEAADR